MSSERKMASSASKTRMGSISKMFPVSWFSKFRRGNVKERKRAKEVKRDHVGLQEERSRRGERFYGEEDEDFWRLSFREEEGIHRRKSHNHKECSAVSVSDDWGDEEVLSPSTCRSCGAKGEKRVRKKKESMDFSEMVLDLRKTRDSSNGYVKMSPETENRKGAKSELRSPELARRDGCLRNHHHQQQQQRQNLTQNPDRLADSRSLRSSEKKMVGDKDEENAVLKSSAIKDILEVNAMKPIQTSMKNSHRSPTSSSSSRHQETLKHSRHGPNEEVIPDSDAVQSSLCEKIGEVKLEELSMGDGEERKSIYISKDSLKRGSKSSGRSSKVKVYSPRTPSKAELCKIRALEDLKKTRMKTRIKEKAEKERAILDSFAVVKSSFDPQRDFRDSMLEMILDTGISRPEELEELLACYLTLNSDEYHELIIKVFRQLWFDLNKDRLDPGLGGEKRCNN